MSSLASWFGNHFTPMLTRWQWLLALAVPPAIVLLYFLKLKRQPLEVPSTFLWRRSIEDLHVNSIWQRLRQNLLLFLQLLIVALALFALLRPGWRGAQLEGDRFIFLVDNSASMNATDVGPNRLAEAKRRVGNLIDEMRSGDVAMLVSFSDNARVEQQFTDNRRELRRRLDAIEPTNRPTQLAEALRVAAGLANPGKQFEFGDNFVSQGVPSTMYIVSDGKFPDVQGFALGNLKPVYVPIGEPGASNIGITSFSVRRGEGKADRLQAFVRVENFGSEPANVEVTLRTDGHIVDADKLEVKPKEDGGLAFNLNDVQAGVLEARISPGGSLAQDDRAWTTIVPPRRCKVLLVTPGNDALEFALSTPRAKELADIAVVQPSVLESKEHLQLAAGGTIDLIIYDQCSPKAMPQANTLFIGRLPPLADWRPSDQANQGEIAGPQVIDIETAHPLMQLIDLGNVLFESAVAVRVPAGGTKLIDSNAGVLFAVAPREGFEDAVLATEIVGQKDGERYANTDWPLRLSFPVFVLNALEYLGHARQAADATGVTPGRLMTLRSSLNADRISIKSPSGKTSEVMRTKGGTFNFADTDELGVYHVIEADKPSPEQPGQEFAVNLFNSAESDIRPRPENTIKIGYVDVKGQTGWRGTRREIWKVLLGLALVVLVGEWYIYNRRVYI